MNVEIVSRPTIPSETYIPRELAELIEAEGLRATWQRNNAEHLSTLHGMGLRPVTRKALDDLGFQYEAQALFFTPEGYIQKHDCVLMIQPREQWDEREAFFSQVRDFQEGTAKPVEELNSEMAELLRKTGVSPAKLKGGGRLWEAAVQVSPASAHVNVNKNPEAISTATGR